MIKLKKLKKKGYLIYNRDSREWLKALIKSGVKVNTIVTDPPYRVISGGKNDKNSPKGMLSSNDGKIFEYNDIEPEEWFPYLYDLLDTSGHCYIMTNTLNIERYLTLAREVGFKLHNILVWEKNNQVVNRWYMKNCEYTLFLYKGVAKPINNVGTSSTVHKFNNPTNKLHPTQKPLGLMELYVLNSSEEGDIVADPFMGSGVTGYVCKRHKRYFLGNEIDPKHFKTSSNVLAGKIHIGTKLQRPHKMKSLVSR